ncbi:MAG: hypothetical protein OXC08_18830 [Thiotrichales bacterium]|nr:hypothetical protein [Thiotrichales bacterium]
MLRAVSLLAALALVGCASKPSPPPPPVVHEIRCPTEPPPEIPDLPPRPNDLRELEADRYRIEGLWSGVQIEQEEYSGVWHGGCKEEQDP